jgi:hypothetical protein
MALYFFVGVGWILKLLNLDMNMALYFFVGVGWISKLLNLDTSRRGLNLLPLAGGEIEDARASQEDRT